MSAETALPPLVTDPAAVTPAWLTTALRRSGALAGGAVVDVSAEPVGTGQVGDSIRFHLTYDEAATGPGDAAPPATVVGKFPAQDETSRAAGTATRTYEVEHHFYVELRHRVDITTPRPHLALFDPATHDFVLLMDDLAPAEQGDQIAGCDADTAALAMEEIAKLHAPVWGEPGLASLPWLNRSSPEGVAGYKDLMRMLVPGFLERYAGRLHDDVAGVVGQILERLDDVFVLPDEPRTAVHGDYRLDNILYGTPESTAAGDPAQITVDWQTVSLGPAMSDVAYFLGTSLDPALRASVERDLVKEHHRTLQAGGVRDVSLDWCWEGYRRNALAGLLMAILASMLVGQTDRGDEMFMAMANRSGRLALDLETLDAL